MTLQHPSEDEEMTKLLAGDKPVVVDWFATWCGPCKNIAPLFAELSAEYADRAVFVKADVDKLQGSAATAKIEAMPTFQVYQNGKAVATIKGADPAALKELVRANCPEVQTWLSESASVKDIKTALLKKHEVDAAAVQACLEKSELIALARQHGLME
eukprot:CAMPEP_0114549126 /NCGR_PEP_ID=MMETSP0114-20121206/5359_1 /TAXON_ID=31324 /ORGANISM="Goniomonas sp, Strain m" /LENGTH=156 /DNA_ID=CAMNT_0001733783 /DNA_START=17 /DNA_END=487 /DNA_ORIENTATION=-